MAGLSREKRSPPPQTPHRGKRVTTICALAIKGTVFLAANRALATEGMPASVALTCIRYNRPRQALLDAVGSVHSGPHQGTLATVQTGEKGADGRDG